MSRRAPLTAVVGALLLFGAATLAWSRWTGPARQERAGCEATAQLLEKKQQAYGQAIARAARWLDSVKAHPVRLRRMGLKGKKHFVEALHAWWRLYQVAPEPERPALLAKVARLTKVTQEHAYHDMGDNSEFAFKQDAMSYLRAALLMERFGLDTTRYREEIRLVQPRLDAHLERRGVHQRMVFAWYYRHFGLEEPFPLARAFQEGLIWRQVAGSTMSKRQIYELTHEVFALHEYGDRLDADPFTPAQKRYLLKTLPPLLEARIARNDPDLVAELVSCLRQLRFTSVPAYRRGLEFLLASQRADGAWGHYEQYRRRLGALLEPKFVLHTTIVAIDALTLALHDPWNGDDQAWCLPAAQ